VKIGNSLGSFFLLKKAPQSPRNQDNKKSIATLFTMSSQKTFIKGQNPRSSWLEEEDARLIELVGAIGERNWALIAQELPGRIGKQCRERWRNHLNPSIRHDPFTEEEDQTIIRLVKELGTRWARISELMEGRTENAIKNRYYCFLKGKFEPRPRKRTKAVLEAELTPPPMISASESDVGETPPVSPNAAPMDDPHDLAFSAPLPKVRRLAVRKSPILTRQKPLTLSKRKFRTRSLASLLEEPIVLQSETTNFSSMTVSHCIGFVSINDLITDDQEDSVPSDWSAAMALCALRRAL